MEKQQVALIFWAWRIEGVSMISSVTLNDLMIDF